MRSTLAAELEVAGNIIFGEVEILLLNPTIRHLPISKNFTLSLSTTMGFATFLLTICPIPLTSAVEWEGMAVTSHALHQAESGADCHTTGSPTILGTASNRLIIPPIHVAMWMAFGGHSVPINSVFLTCAGNTITYFNTLGTCIPVGSHSILDCCYKRPQT